jgi:hypothetical protein
MLLDQLADNPIKWSEMEFSNPGEIPWSKKGDNADHYQGL